MGHPINVELRSAYLVACCVRESSKFHHGHAAVLVELFALPGAGKSTIAEAAAKQSHFTTRKNLSLAWAETSVRNRVSHLVESLISPRHLAAAARLAIGGRMATRESVFRLGRLLAKRDWLRSRRDLILLDQGYMQELWSILVSGKSENPDPEHLSHLIKALYEGIDAKIVVISVDPALAASRITGRPNGHSRFDDLPEIELRRRLESAVGLHERIVEAACRAGLSVHIFDGADPLHVLADELVSLLPVRALRTEAKDRPSPRRISVIGSTGSGKTRLSRLLAKRLDLPHFELDGLRIEAIGSSFEEAVATVTSGKDWIVDGHYRDVRHLIWSRAELVVWLNYPVPVVGMQLLRRFLRKRLRTAKSANSLEVKVSVAGAHPSATWGQRLRRFARTLRERREYGRILYSPDYRHLRVVELKSRRMTQLWLECL